jgi:hypothetical protein
MQMPVMPHPWRGVRPFRRHSLVLLVAGFVYVAFGFTLVFIERTRAQERAIEVALDRWPAEVWGVIWVIAGCLAIVSSKWPPISETWGYFVLTGLSAGWATIYATGVIFEGSPTSNLSGTLVWGLVAFLWWAISGLVNPETLVTPVPSENG